MFWFACLRVFTCGFAPKAIMVVMLAVASGATAEERLAPPRVWQLPVKPPPPVQRPDFLQGLDLNALKLYFRLVSAKKFKQAERVKSASSRPILREYAQLMRLKESRCDHNHAEISAFIKSHPDWPFQKELRANAECSIPKRLHSSEVLEIFQKTPPLSAEGRFRLIEALLGTNQKERAKGESRKLWREGNFSRRFEKKFIRRYSRQWDKEDNVHRLDRLLWEYRRSAALRTAYRMDKGYQRLAEARIALRRAAGGVDAAIAKVPKELQGDEGLRYERLRWRIRKNKKNAADLLPDPECDLKKPSYWARQRIILIRRLESKGQFVPAYKIARSHCQKPEGKQAEHYAELEWLAGKNALRLKRRALALSHFSRSHSAAVSAPGRARAAYWAGRVAETSPDAAAARKWFAQSGACESCFYGQLSLQKLGGKITLRQTALPTTVVESARKSRLLLLSRLLVTAGRKNQISPFFYSLFARSRLVEEKNHIIDMADSYGRPDLAVRLANKSRWHRGSSHWGGYPVLAHEDYSGVEESLVLALIRQESAFMVRAASHAGARGLMQVMPATAKHVGRQIGLKYSKSRLSGDAVYNLKMGSSYLKMMLQKYGGSYPLALAAYNAGPGRVDAWLKNKPAPLDMALWVESIPITETRNYVKEVLTSLSIYRALLGNGDAQIAGLASVRP